MISRKTLDNNIVLITQHLEKCATATIGFWIKTGSRFEKEGFYGISHFTEHLVFKGTKSRSTRDISCTFDRMGGYINAFTERENVCLFCTIPVAENKDKNLSLALDVLCDIKNNAVFPDEEFIREKAVVQNEIYSIEDDAEETALDVLAEKMWPNQKISRKITGSVEDVESITKEMIVDWYNKYFVNGELTVIAAGNLNQQILEESLNKLHEHKKVLVPAVENHFEEKIKWQQGSYIEKSVFNQVQFYNSFNVPMPFTLKDHFVSSVFNAFAGDSMSSRLFTEIREKNGLCYSVYSFFTFYENAAIWCACASCDKKNIGTLNLKLNEELKKLIENPISDEELQNGIEHICGEEIIGGEDCEYLMKRLEHYNSMGFPILETSEICDGIRSITKNDIINFMKKLLRFEEKCQLVYGPSECKKLIKKQIRKIMEIKNVCKCKNKFNCK